MSRVEYLFQFCEQMPDEELRKELAREGQDTGGDRRQLLRRFRAYHRKALVEIRKRHRSRTEDFYNYFIVIDFECSCEEGNYDFEHEIIEFPAQLVSVRSRKIVDKFRTIVRPGKRPKLTEFCTNLTGITQAMVDRAPTFPEALRLFRCWMAKHGLDGDGNSSAGGNAKRFCYVTDGPWDIGKFFQMQCQQSDVEIPHDFRAYMNIRRAFINFYCHPRHGQGGGQGHGQQNGQPQQQQQPVKLPTVDLRAMLDHLGMDFEGREHCGMDDTRNIARILVRMLEDGAELRVNEKLVHGPSMRPWQQLIFDEHKKAPSCPASGASSAENVVVSSNTSQEDVAAQIADNFARSLNIGDGKEEGEEDRPAAAAGAGDVIVWRKWWDQLPYKLVRISRVDFLGERHLECESCDGEEEGEEGRL